MTASARWRDLFHGLYEEFKLVGSRCQRRTLHVVNAQISYHYFLCKRSVDVFIKASIMQRLHIFGNLDIM